MPPPTQSAPNPAVSEVEEGESQDFDQMLKQELLKSRLNTIRKQQQECQDELVRLEHDKEAHIRESRRLRDESDSVYGKYPVLNKHYQIVELLGKGGFSEVWRAYDLQNLCDVAIKIHQLNPSWSDDRRSSYIRHALREGNIQKVR